MAVLLATGVDPFVPALAATFAAIPIMVLLPLMVAVVGLSR